MEVEGRFTGTLSSDEAPLKWWGRLLQVTDPAFPTGGYAHSLGLEARVAAGDVDSTERLSVFLREEIGPSLVYQELPYIRFGLQAAGEGDLPTLLEIDAELDAMKWAGELREASRAQGARRLALLQELWPHPLVEAFAAEVRARRTPAHQALVLALQAHCLEIPLTATLQASAYQTVSGIVQAALKLLRLGQRDCQRVLSQVMVDVPGWVHLSLEIERAEAGWMNPALDIASARHATAFSRLFLS